MDNIIHIITNRDVFVSNSSIEGPTDYFTAQIRKETNRHIIILTGKSLINYFHSSC